MKNTEREEQAPNNETEPNQHLMISLVYLSSSPWDRGNADHIQDQMLEAFLSLPCLFLHYCLLGGHVFQTHYYRRQKRAAEPVDVSGTNEEKSQGCGFISHVSITHILMTNVRLAQKCLCPTLRAGTCHEA